jgi:hypothetical protein
VPLTPEEREGLRRLVAEARREEATRQRRREVWQALRWREADDPEVSARKAAGLRRHWQQNPERRAQMSDSMRAMWADSEHRERHRAAMRAAWERRGAKQS